MRYARMGMGLPPGRATNETHDVITFDRIGTVQTYGATVAYRFESGRFTYAACH